MMSAPEPKMPKSVQEVCTLKKTIVVPHNRLAVPHNGETDEDNA